MFYSHDILQKRGGKFGIIWIAATKGVSLTKRDYCSVCVPKSCDDIIKYITLKAQPQSRKGSRPRFSLYLSSQLMVGVARIFEKQFSYFIVDVHELHKRTTRFTTSCFDDVITTQIQLKKSARSADFCTMPESNLFHDDEFGVMRGLDTSPDPLLLPEIEMFSVSPYRSAKLSTSLLQLSPSQMDKLVMESPSHLVTSASEISLREDDSTERDEIQIPDIDLPPVEGIAEIMADMYQQEGDEEPIQGDEGKGIPLSPTSGMGDQLWAVDDQTGQLLLTPSPKGKPAGLRTRRSMQSPPRLEDMSPIPLQGLLSSPRQEDRDAQMEDRDVQMEDGEEMVEDVVPTEMEDERKAQEQGLVTPATGAVMQNILRLSPIDSVSPSPARRRGRKRRLVFADATTQLSKKDIRHNMSTVENLTRREQTIIPKSYPTAKELFEEPARKSLKRSIELHFLWKMHSQLRIAVTDPEVEDEDAPAWSTAYTRPRELVRGSSTETTTSPEEQDEDVEGQRGIPQFAPEIVRQEISASPERLRDISMETSQQRPKFEDTPQSIIISDASHLSESKDSFRQKSFHAETSAQRSLHRPTGDSSREMEEAIPEELLDVRELPVLPEEDLVMEPPELEEPVAPEMISTSEDEGGKKTRREKTEAHIPHENVLRGIGELTAEFDSITFKDLVPPNTYRTVAAKIFSVCLDYAALGLVRVAQETPYGDILIQRGPAF